MAPARGPEGLDGEHLPLLHLGLVCVAHDGHALAGVDLVGPDGVAVQVADGLHGVSGAVEFHLEGLHHLLDLLPDVAEADVDAGGPDAGVRGLLHRGQQLLVPGVECYCPGTVNNTPLNLCTKVHLHHVAVLERDVAVGWIRRVVRGHVVEGDAGGEADAPLQPRLLHQLAVLVLQRLAQVPQLHARLDEALAPAAHLAVALGGLADLVQQRLLDAVEGALLGAGHAVGVQVQRVLLDLPLGEHATREQGGDWDCGWFSLAVANIAICEAPEHD
mmetsp:Transcript_5035/g.7834  ORF Transcript_5035/g.7834 Transcript_5035/m.7834 type:complete len:274 (-) Transcript_5035:73-894(-)